MNLPVSLPVPASAELKRRKVMYVTGTRADFGLMQSTLLQLAEVADVSLAVTGMHLAPGHGDTVQDIVASGLPICAQIPCGLASRDAASMSLALAQCLQGLTPMLQRERPDTVLLLGDRGEMLAGAIAALHQGIASVHVHGGERSGTVDEPVRHAISKLSTYHLAATSASRERLVRMGELPAHIFVTGAPGLDGLEALAALPRQACCAQLGLPSDGAFVLALFHPVVQQAGQAYAQTQALLQAACQSGLPVVWLEPNADAGSMEIVKALDAADWPPGSRRIPHLDRPLFCAAMRHAAVLLGNSSAGIIEAASLGTPVVNVGDRQRLRERNANVLDVAADQAAIAAAIKTALHRGHYPPANVYGDGHAAGRIVQLLCTLPLAPGVLEKCNTY